MGATIRTLGRGAPLGAAAALVAASAAAHEVGLSRGEYAVDGASVRAELVFARRELIGLVAGLDADHDGALTPAEIAAGRGSIEGALIGRIKVSGDGVPCPGAFERADLAEQDGIAVHAVYRCPRRPRKLQVSLTFLDDLSFGHRHLARATAGASLLDQVLSQRAPSLSLDVPAEAGPPVPEAAAAPGAPLLRGALHVIARPLGPAFLVALLATCASRRASLLAAASFTLAAALGAWLGARGVFAPTRGVVEAAIALSLVYVGVEAMGSPNGDRRLWVAAPFGVVHGLGLAAALGAGNAGELGAFGAGALLPLAIVTAALVPATEWARRRQALTGRRLAALGALVAGAGALALVAGRP